MRQILDNAMRENESERAREKNKIKNISIINNNMKFVVDVGKNFIGARLSVDKRRLF